MGRSVLGWACVFVLVALPVVGCSDESSGTRGTGGMGGAPDGSPNVVLILIDDLRPELESYGRLHVVSPNIDALAAEGLLFENAYAQVPVCGASRASLFAGLRPTRTRFTRFDTRLCTDAPDVTSLPELFRDNGYMALSNGKVLHHVDDCVGHWSEPPWRANGAGQGQKVYALTENAQEFEELGRSVAFEAANVDDFAYPSGQVVEKSIADLERLAGSGEPFFLAVGLWKPHLPFNAPTRYWDLYDPDLIPGPEPPDRATDAPDVAFHDSPELRNQYTGIPPAGEPIPPQLARALRHGYLASVSYVDALVGRLLDAVEEQGLDDNTIIVLVGDHGFLLGEQTIWTKEVLFDATLRVPLLIRAPGFAKGARTAAIAELLDLYPTLADLAGLPLPDPLDGASLRPVLEEPAAPGKGFAVSRFNTWFSLEPGLWFGESIRTDHWLYTEWPLDDGTLHGRMLYDHDVDSAETTNIAEIVDPAIVDALSEELRAITGTAAKDSGATTFGREGSL